MMTFVVSRAEGPLHNYCAVAVRAVRVFKEVPSHVPQYNEGYHPNSVHSACPICLSG